MDSTREERAAPYFATAERLMEQGKPEIASEIEALGQFILTPPPTEPRQPTPKRVGVRMSDVEPMKKLWLWIGRLCWEVVMLFGPSGSGKSTFWADLVARITKGAVMPDGSPGTLGTCIIVDPEDERETTLWERLDSAGADMSKVIDLSEVELVTPDSGGSLKRSFKLPNDLHLIERALKENPDTLLIVLDNVRKLCTGISTYRDATVIEKVLNPLNALAREYQVCILFVAHTRKGSEGRPIMDAAGMANAFTSDPRVVLGWTIDDTNSERRCLSNAKYNHVDPPANPMTCELDKASGRLVWLSGWTLTEEGKMKARQLSQARKDIITLLESEPRCFTSNEIGRRCGIPGPLCRVHLSHMKDDGQIAYPAYNQYCSLRLLTKSEESNGHEKEPQKAGTLDPVSIENTVNTFNSFNVQPSSQETHVEPHPAGILAPSLIEPPQATNGHKPVIL